MKPSLLIFIIICSINSFAGNLLKVGDKAPDFAVQDLNGKSINLYSLQGKVILLDFWASWCAPCRTANKELVKIYKDYKENGFEVFSVSLDSDKNAWAKAVEKDKITWQYNGTDLKEWDSSPAQLYSITALPTTFLIDENGIIIAQGHDLLQIQLSLNEYLYNNTAPYPKNTSDKIFLSKKEKFEVTDSTGNIILRGKEDIIDVKELKDGNYTLKTENIVFAFNKITSISHIEIDPKSIFTNIPDSAFFEIYNRRGILQHKGIGKSILEYKFLPGLYFININGKVSKFEKGT